MEQKLISEDEILAMARRAEKDHREGKTKELKKPYGFNKKEELMRIRAIHYKKGLFSSSALVVTLFMKTNLKPLFRRRFLRARQ